MDRLALRCVLSLLAVLGASQGIASCQARQAPVAAELQSTAAMLPSRYDYHHTPKQAHVEPPRAALDGPDKCRKLVYKGRGADRYIGKTQPAWLRNKEQREAKQAELRELIFAVADEMGADELAAEMIWRKAIYESSGDASNLHLLNPDIAANRSAANKGRRHTSERWKRAEVVVYEDIEEAAYGEPWAVPAAQVDAWAFGRGLYGQVTGLHMHRWSPDAPPWALCDPLVATVTTIWAMRAGLEECHGETLRDAYRRFSSGKCAVRSAELEGRFDRLARGRVRGLKLPAFDPDARAELGTRWGESTADREVLLGTLRKRTATGS